MDIPSAVKEGAVRFSWRQSKKKADRVVSVIELDFGETNMTPSEASSVQLAIIGICRSAFGVSLSKFR